MTYLFNCYVFVTEIRHCLLTACKFLPDEYNPHGYLTLEHNGLRIRACPEGTIFSARQCGCRRGSGPMRNGRRRMRG